MSSLTNRIATYPVLAVLSLVWISLLSGCATQAPVEVEDAPELVWPAPPEQGVIRYVGQLMTIKGLGLKKPKFADIIGGAEKEEPAERLQKPFGVYAGSQERVFVADTTLGALIVYDQKTGLVEQWGKTGPGRLTKPMGVAVDGFGRVYVVDVTDRRVVVFDSSGNFLNAFGGQKAFDNPVAIAININLGRVYVADSKLHQVKAFDLDGVELLSVGEKGPGPGQFMFPSYLAIGSDNRVFVSDSMNFRVQILDSDLNYLKSFGQVGQRLGDLNRPKGIALDRDGHVYVTDASFNNFQIFTEDGELLLYVGEMGSEQGQFVQPTGIYIDENSRIYIADQLNQRVQIFDYLGAPDVAIADDKSDGEKDIPVDDS